MPIRWDALLVRHLARELDSRLRGARLRAVRLDGERRDLVLLFRETTLVWRLHPSRGYPLLFPPQDPAEGDLSLSAKVRLVEAPPDERFLRVELLPVRGRRRAVDLVVELLGNQWNAAVTEGPERRIRHVLHRREGKRRFSVGACWSPPEPSTRLGIDASSVAPEWVEISRAEGTEARTRLVSSVAWASPLNADYILGGTDVEPSPEEVSRRWRSLVDPDAASTPVVLELARGAQPYPFPLPGIPSRGFESLLAALEHCAQADEAADSGAPLLLSTDLLKALEGAVERAQRRATRLQAELDRLGDPDASQRLGDLLLARFNDVPAGGENAVLEDFEGNPVEIALDPMLSVHANAAKYYDGAARIRRAMERLPGMISEADKRRRLLEEVLESARAGDADEERVRSVLPQQGRRAVREGRSHQAPSLPYHTFQSSGGLEIRVGRGAKHNAELTFRHSSPDDIWLHARHAAGAHVILRWNRPGSPPARDLEQAAVLAALNSKARTSGTVPVDWTLRKYVRKPRGAPPGTVIPDRVKTVFVEPDPSLLEALAVHPLAE